MADVDEPQAEDVDLDGNLPSRFQEGRRPRSLAEKTEKPTCRRRAQDDRRHAKDDRRPEGRDRQEGRLGEAERRGVEAARAEDRRDDGDAPDGPRARADGPQSSLG